MSRPDVLILGAGVIGCAIARELALQGLDVVVLEGEHPGAGASWAAAGMLSPHPGGDEGAGGPGLALCVRSLGMYPALATALRQETGIDVELGDGGLLEVARDRSEEADVRQRLSACVEGGLAGEWLAADEVRRLEPELAPGLHGGAFYPGRHQLDSRRLVRALAVAAGRAGARIEAGRPVSALWVESSRLRGVLVGGERREAGHVVVASGCGSAALVPPGRGPLPVKPVRGQIVALESSAHLLGRAVVSEDGYLVPRRDGRVLAGTTLEPGERVARPTARGVARIADAAVSLLPALASCPFGTAWAGLRPCTPDGRPILGRDEQYPDLLYATGHGTNGILLAPVTAEWIARCLAGKPAPLERGPFLPSRFEGAAPGRGGAGSPSRPVA